MKGSPMQRNFNIGVANKTGVSGLTSKGSPVKWAWLLGLIPKVIAGAKVIGAKLGVAATTAGAKIAGAVGAKGLAAKLTTTAGKIGTWGMKAQAAKAAATAAMTATKTGKFLASKTGKALTTAAKAKLVESMISPPRQTTSTENPTLSDFASMKFGTGGSRSAFTMKKSPIYNYKTGYYGA